MNMNISTNFWLGAYSEYDHEQGWIWAWIDPIWDNTYDNFGTVKPLDS